LPVENLKKHEKGRGGARQAPLGSKGGEKKKNGGFRRVESVTRMGNIHAKQQDGGA